MPVSNIKRYLPPWEKWKRLSFLLAPLGWMYGVGMEIRNRLYDFGILKTHKPSVPVVSIGNLTVGGTGKTPLTIEIAKGLRERTPDLAIGIISRGYGRKKTGGWVVSDGEKLLMNAKESGDEAFSMERELFGVKV